MEGGRAASQCLHFSFNDNPLDRAGEPQHFLNVCVMCFEGIFFDSYITVDKVCKFLQAPTFSSFLSVGRLVFLSPCCSHTMGPKSCSGQGNI